MAIPYTRYFLNDKGYGLVFSKPTNLYTRANAEKKNYIVVKDSKEFVSDASEKLEERLLSDKHMEGQRIVYERSETIVRYMTTIHKRFMMRYEKSSAAQLSSVEKTDSYTQFDIIFVDVGPMLKHTVIQISLMYMCLLHMGIEMPELYLIVSFPTDDFDFVEFYIFNDPTDTSKNISGEMRQAIGQTSSAHFRGLESITEELEKNRKKLDRHDAELRFMPFNENSFDDIYNASLLIVISEDSYGWSDLIGRTLKRNVIRFNDIKSFIGSDNRNPNSLSMITINSPDDLLSLRDASFDDVMIKGIILFDSRIKVEIDLHYLGNVKRSREATPKWFNYYIGLLNRAFPDTKIFLDHKHDAIPVVISTKERTPISDVLFFKNEKISLLELYQNYYNTTTEYTQAITNSQDALSRLGYFDKNSPKIHENLHPIFPRMLQIWTEKGYPKLAFLIVIAVVTSYNHKYTEIKKNDEQTSRFEDLLEHYLDLVAKSDFTFQNDVYGIGDRLKKLCEAYMTKEDTYMKYRFQDIMKSLLEIIHEHFDNYIISLHMDSYRSKFNQNMVWKLSGTGNEEQAMPKNIFPLVVYSTGRTKKVALYIPVGT